MKILKHVLSLGLNDKDSKKQFISTLDAANLTSNIVAKYYSGASITPGKGFYRHEDGTLTFEESIFITILFANDKTTRTLIDELKRVFNQESIAYEHSKVESELA